ncbi:MAG: hypothetical protein LC799_31140, partial [Actinobacteria bacterium]|nr:hypothetical protein [Actinomycetota bacterium]
MVCSTLSDRARTPLSPRFELGEEGGSQPVTTPGTPNGQRHLGDVLGEETEAWFVFPEMTEPRGALGRT